MASGRLIVAQVLEFQASGNRFSVSKKFYPVPTGIFVFPMVTCSSFLFSKSTEIVHNIFTTERAKVAFSEFITEKIKLPNLFSEHVLMK